MQKRFSTFENARWHVKFHKYYINAYLVTMVISLINKD